MKLKVKDVPGLYRDSKSKAIISEDQRGYSSYMQERQLRQQFQDVKQDVNKLQGEIGDIKNMLLTLMLQIEKTTAK